MGLDEVILAAEVLVNRLTSTYWKIVGTGCPRPGSTEGCHRCEHRPFCDEVAAIEQEIAKLRQER